MASNSSVAIVMRTYERPIMLARAITSVCKQTYPNWSLTIVNNGGVPKVVDDVVAIARISWPEANIHVMHLADRVGMEEASNTALAHTASDYFAIHDDDDTWKPRFLEVVVPALDEHSEAVTVVSGVTRIYELARGKTLRPQKSELFALDSEKLTFDGMIGHNTFPPIAALFRRSLLDAVGMFDASLPVLGDWEFNLRALKAGPFFYMPERLANYHTRTPDSDAATGNSITVGQDLHREIKDQLIQRWQNEKTPDGRNKGEVAQAAHQQFVQREAALHAAHLAGRTSFVVRQLHRSAYAAKHPSIGARAVIRRVRRKIGR